MKKILAAALVLVSTASVASAGSIRVYNSDSKNYTVELKCSGSSAKIEIRGSTTTTYTFHSTSKECDITGGGISWPTSKMTDGGSWTIKDAKAKSN